MCDEEQDLDPIKPLHYTNEDAAWGEMQRAIAQNIYQAFSITPEELGVIADSNTSFSPRYLELSFYELLQTLCSPFSFLPDPPP